MEKRSNYTKACANCGHITEISEEIDSAYHRGRESVENQYVGERIIDEHLARQQLLDELLEEVRGKKKDDPGADGEYDGAIMLGFNKALSEVEQILLKKKGSPTIGKAGVAPMVEQGFEVPRVVGSNPASSTKD